MAWFISLLSSAGARIVEAVGSAADELFSSDEELALTEIQKTKIKTAYEVRLKELMVELDQQQAEHERSLENELTERLQLDKKSDSWLSKNIRPMSLIFMTAVVSVLALFTVFDSDLKEGQLQALKTWVPFFQILMMTIYAFYFGSRGLEKVQKIRSAGKVEEANKRQFTYAGSEAPKG
jgi:hypothetical protein